MSSKATAPLSLGAYARHRGCRINAVQEAIKSGRLRKCLTPAGKIASSSAADAEWEATTLENRRPLSGPAGTDPLQTLAESRQRREAAEATMAEIELAKVRGELVLTRDVEAKVGGLFTQCKTKLLAIPARARQQDPALSLGQLALFEALIREALEDLASAGEAAP